MDIDGELIEAVAGGDEGALAALLDRRGALVSAFVHRRLWSERDAEEAVCDVWVACWRNASTFRHECSVRTWLLGIARNQVMTRYRTRSRRPQMVELPDTTVDSGPGPLEQVVSAAAAADLIEAIRGLSPKLYETAMLAWLEELPYHEIGEILGVPTGTVKSRIWQARAHLRTVLDNPDDHGTTTDGPRADHGIRRR